MNIRFISSLDPEDESRFASAVLAAVAKLLDEFPIAYTIRMETGVGKVLEHHHASDAAVSGFTPRDLWESSISARAKSASEMSKRDGAE